MLYTFVDQAREKVIEQSTAFIGDDIFKLTEETKELKRLVKIETKKYYKSSEYVDAQQKLITLKNQLSNCEESEKEELQKQISKSMAEIVTKNITIKNRLKAHSDKIKYNEDIIRQAADLFLYAAIVLATFSVFMLFNYISLSISSKKQTIGILRTLGANKKNIVTMFITEALIISLIIGIISSAVAFGACLIVNTYIVEVMNLTFKIALFDIRQILLIISSSLITGIISSLRPIIKVSKKKPVELIRTL